MLLDLQGPPVPVASLGVWVCLASEAPLGRTGSVVRREQQAKKGAQGRLAPGVILVLPGSLGHLEKGMTVSRGCVDCLEYLDPQEPRGTEEHLGSLALLVAVVTQASVLLDPLALRDHQETKGHRALEDCPGSLAPRDQLARTVHQEVQEKEGLLGNQALLHYRLQGT